MNFTIDDLRPMLILQFTLLPVPLWVLWDQFRQHLRVSLKGKLQFNVNLTPPAASPADP